MSAAGSPNDAAHAFHRLGRHPGRVGRHQLERWVVMLSEWWVAMTRYAQGKTLTFPSVEPACPDRISHPVTCATGRACLQRDVCCQKGPRDAVARRNAPGRRRKMYQALAAASVSSRSFHLQEAPFGGPPPIDDKHRVSCRCEFCVVPSALELAAANAEQRSELLRRELQPLHARSAVSPNA